MATMNARQIVSIALVATLWLTNSLVTCAQSNWPTAKKAAAVPKSSPEKHRKRAKPAATISAAPGKQASSRTSLAATPDQVTLRAMSEIIARQTLAIEALAVRLEAAERRLDLATAPALVRLKSDTTEAQDISEALVDDPFDPFRAARAVDWAQVLEGLVP